MITTLCKLCDTCFEGNSIPRHCPECTACWHDSIWNRTILECGEPYEEQLELFKLEESNDESQV